jgi:hypothetical protein
MPRRWGFAAVLAALVCASWAQPSAGQTFGLYDDFSSGPLDPQRWLGYEYTVGKYESRAEHYYGTPDWGEFPTDPTNLTSMRRVVGGQAQIALTSYRGSSGALYGYGAKARSGLRVNHEALADHRPAVTAFRATVTVIRASVPTVPPEMVCYYSDVGKARAELVGHFFNDGTSTGPDDLTGDIFALVGLGRRVESSDSGEVVRNVVEFGLGRCNNADCSRVRGGSASLTFARDWTIGVPYVVSIVWQPASNALVFTVDGGGTTESHTLTYAYDDQTIVRGYAYDLRVETRPRRCYTQYGAPYQVPQEVSIDARFDEVQLNSTAATAAAR